MSVHSSSIASMVSSVAYDVEGPLNIKLNGDEYTAEEVVEGINVMNKRHGYDHIPKELVFDVYAVVRKYQAELDAVTAKHEALHPESPGFRLTARR